jgi:hypothetical protein
MTSSRAEASRINGSKSRGPKTERGRLTASLNAVKHGLSAQTVVLPGEPRQEYESELQGYLDHFAPANKPEADLVRQLAAVSWRLARYASVETNILDFEMVRQRDRVDEQWTDIDEPSRLALAFTALSGAHSSLALLNRYQSRLHHEYQRILKTLLQMQAARRAGQAKLQNEPRQHPIEQPNAPTHQPETQPPETRELETREPPATAILPYWKALSSNGSPRMATSPSFRSWSSASSGSRSPMNSC